MGAGNRRATIAVVLVVLGAVSWLLASSASQPHGYSAHEAPPYRVRVTQGQQYSIDTADGLAAMGGQATGLVCTLTARDGAATALTLTVETSDKALHRIATFVAPVSGSVHVACSGTTAVYVDDADGTVDAAGLLRVLAAVLLAIGLPLGLSVLANPHSRRRAVAVP